MSIVKISKRGQVVIPKPIRDKLGLVEGVSLNAFLEDKRIVLISKPESDLDELLVDAGPEDTREALEYSREMDERKIVKLLKDIGVESGSGGD
ncbi:MAG: AbrB/MazE/SpoVT family DNA-binding domain-containing protein [Candidatus Hydrothermarchaeota archaeon]|nr:AbrB/MazE/SpoVT family DNA-binding domain-containing protein [Candidatus Hydrothermarchaeota archaeon]